MEELWTHLERTIHDLDDVVRQIQHRLDGLERRVDRLAERLEETPPTDVT